MKNDLLLRVLRGEPVPRTPVWMMRQAGRYLPEYRATREVAGQFMTLCQTPELACEVTLQPLARFPLDAAILFSDILTIPDAMGLGLSFVPGEGPAFDRPVRSPADVQALPIPDMNDDLGYVMQAVRLIKRELDGRVPLIGFAGSPWTLATYMIEGEASRDFARAKAMLYQEPRTLHALLDKLARAVTAYLLAQIEAGAQLGRQPCLAGVPRIFPGLHAAHHQRHRRQDAGHPLYQRRRQLAGNDERQRRGSRRPRLDDTAGAGAAHPRRKHRPARQP